MLGMGTEIMGEFMGGAVYRSFLEKPLGPYSEGWARKAFNEKSSPVDFVKLKKKMVKHFTKTLPAELKERYSELDIEVAPVRSPLPNVNVEAHELTFGEVAPLVMYFLRDISRPIDIENWGREERYPSGLFLAFPYCHWWQFSESTIDAGKITVEMAVDACLAYFACLFIDTELQMDLDEAIEKFLLPGISKSYSSKYAVAHYVDYRAECIKAYPKASLEKFYRLWADSEGHGDRDRMEKRLKEWRNKKNPVQPSLRLFGDFVYNLTDGSIRSFYAECEIVGLFLIVQMIQRYRGQKNGKSMILGPETFYRNRVHFWYDKLTEHYSDVIARRAAERERKKSDPV
ncbi:hypothetical protein NBRC116585_23890 [Thalassolituus maritimus]|uniref:Uncharacterized protein n=2 Tax=Thalassolituus maritimus TaxID=484498 RepID=A0ABQ0A1J1_9GAMM